MDVGGGGGDGDGDGHQDQEAQQDHPDDVPHPQPVGSVEPEEFPGHPEMQFPILRSRQWLLAGSRKGNSGLQFSGVIFFLVVVCSIKLFQFKSLSFPGTGSVATTSIELDIKSILSELIPSLT